MKPNISSLLILIEKKFDGNKAAFSKAIGVERSHVSHILNTGQGAGAQFFGALYKFCENEELNFKDYIFLPSNVKILTSK